jgi:hypothetical protein
MSVFSIILLVLILGAWIIFGLTSFGAAQKETGLSRLIKSLAAILLIVGALGFFGSGLSATGGLNWLPQSFEWPVGTVSGVVSTPDHFFAVPLTAPGRVQIYDSDWKFIRGWHVDAGGGTFKLKVGGTNQLEVITARGQWHYVFNLNGGLQSREHYTTGAYSAFSSEGKSYTVPTAPWLWVFTGPFYSWLCAMAGFAVFWYSKQISGRSSKKN